MANVLTEKDPRFRGLNVKVGMFIILALVIAAMLLGGLAVRQGLFEPKTLVVFQAASGEDLRPGMAVKLSGFKIGEVSKVELSEGAEVDVDMQIEQRYMKWIRADSVAVLNREGLIGDSYIAMTAGHADQPALEKGGVVAFHAGAGLADIAADLRNRIIPIIGEVTTLLHYANDPKGDIRQSVKETRELLAEVRQTRKKLDSAVTDLDTLQKDDVRGTLAHVRTTLDQVDGTLKHVDEQVPVLAGEVGDSLKQVNQSLQKVDKATAAAAAAADQARTTMTQVEPHLNHLLDDSRGFVNNSSQAVTAMRRHWPFQAPAAAAAASGRCPPRSSPLSTSGGIAR